MKYEEENKGLLHQLEESKIEVNELKKQISIYENKIHSNLEVREDKINNQQSEIKELEQELEQKSKKIRDFVKEKQTMEKRYEEDYQALRDELDISKEKIIQLSKNEAIIEVYKRKIDSMAQLKSDLKDFQDRCQALQEENQLLEKDRENNKNMKEYINHLDEALSNEKSKCDSLEKELRRAKEKAKYAEDRVQELEGKLYLDKERYEELESEVKQKDKELKQMRLEERTEEESTSLGPESQKANMRERMKMLEKENAILKQELENKFDKEKAIIQNKL